MLSSSSSSRDMEYSWERGRRDRVSARAVVYKTCRGTGQGRASLAGAGLLLQAGELGGEGLAAGQERPGVLAGPHRLGAVALLERLLAGRQQPAEAAVHLGVGVSLAQQLAHRRQRRGPLPLFQL